jgi:hypothetical protein
MSNPRTPAARGEASGKHQGLRQPADDQRVEDALDNTGLADRGELMEDHLRDRHSKGVRGGYDDSIDRDVDTPAQDQARTGDERSAPRQQQKKN